PHVLRSTPPSSPSSYRSLSSPRSPRSPRSHRRQMLLAGASVFALIVAQAVPAQAGRALDALGGQGGGVNAVSNAQAAAIAAAQNAAAAGVQSRRNVTRAIDALKGAQQAQAEARRAAQAAASSIHNGLGLGGLDPNGVTVTYDSNGAATGIDLTSADNITWRGVGSVTQTGKGGGKVQVDIEQNKQQAILTWKSFNVGRDTTLNFNQADSSFVALNRVTGGDIAPSQILGAVNAKGSVYVINRNGIVFGGASQVNVHALIASTADMVNTSTIYSSGNAPSFTGAGNGSGSYAGLVRVEEGAEIATAAPTSATSGGGFVMLLGQRVENEGTISTPKGQALLAAGENFIVRPGYSTETNKYSTTRGSEIAPVIASGDGGWVADTAGTVANSGIIFARQGDITLAGHAVTQSGVLIATSSVNIRGTVHLLNAASDTSGAILLGAGSVTQILPELDSAETALDSQRDGLIKASDEANRLRAADAPFDNLSLLADRLDQGRIEIVTGGTAVFEGGKNGKDGSLTIAQGGQIAVSAGNRVFTADGAVLDVSGVTDVLLPMSANQIKVNIQGSELKDSPVNRDSDSLRNEDVWIDIRDLILVPKGTGGYDSDRYYTKGGLLELSGHLANTKHKIGEWAAIGGTITLSAPEVVAQTGSVFNLSGGMVSYEGGTVHVANVIGADGRVYTINDAPAGMLFIGMGDETVVSHKRWGMKESYRRPFGLGRETTYTDTGYTVGRDAGKLILSTPTSVFEGTILAAAYNGQRQTNARPSGVTDGYKHTQNTAAMAGALWVSQYGVLGRTGVYDTDIRIGDIKNITQTMAALDTLGRDANTVWLNADWLNGQGLGGLTLATGGIISAGNIPVPATRGTITLESDLKLADGGVLELIAPTIDIAAKVTTRGGSVIASNQLLTREVSGTSVFTRTTDLLAGSTASVILRNGAMIDTRGLWTNAQLDPENLRGLAFINGGSVMLRSTGDVTLEAGSRIDTSSGGAILIGGKTAGGKGGDVSLLAGYGGKDGTLTLNGAIRGYGVNGGGTLALSSAGFVVIGGKGISQGSTLEAGTAAPFDLALADVLTIPAGTPLPLGFSATITKVFSGDFVPAGAELSGASAIVGSAGWTVPAGMVAYIDSDWNTLYTGGHTFPAGTILGEIDGAFPDGYRIPANSFNADGVWLSQPITVSYTAGSVQSHDVSFAAGTVIPKGMILGQDATVQAVSSLSLDPGLFQSGFSKYSVNGQRGVTVPAGVDMAPVMPVYQLDRESWGAATGRNLDDVASLVTPDLYLADPVKATLIQRGGVDLELLAGRNVIGTTIFSGGSVTVEKDASITVDPGRKIDIGGGGQIVVDGTITAHGGAINILNKAYFSNDDIGGLSVWIGEHARLDASARAATFVDMRGRLYGVVPNGGTVALGSRGGAVQSSDGGDPSNAIAAPEAYVVVRRGAIIDVSGTSAERDLIMANGSASNSAARRLVASDGGSIILTSLSGIYNDGTLLGRAGGVGASGGTLTLNLEAPIYSQYWNAPPVPERLLAGRTLLITQDDQDSGLPADLVAGVADANLNPGYASLSMQKVAAGGFDSLSLFARTAIVFDGNVTLAAGRSIALRTSNLFQSVDGGHATVSAPYVMMDGQFVLEAGQGAVLPSLLPAYPTTGTVTVQGGLIDVVNRMNAKVGKLIIDSSGDLRFLAYSAVPTSSSMGGWTILASSGDLDLVARRIYPATDARVQIYAGTPIDSSGSPIVSPFSKTPNTGTVEIRSHGDQPVTAPNSVFGRLDIVAGTIRQGGNLFAPLGALSLQALVPYETSFQTSADQGLVSFLPGSLTSVSAKGLVIPYGGTVDGVSFTVNGKKVLPYDLLTGTIVVDDKGDYVWNNGSGRQGITVTGSTVVGGSGAVFDLSGGGTLAGAGFVSGRGGSVDALVNPLINANPGNTHSSASNKVYAIVPGFDVAPSTASYSSAWTGAMPGVGEQITIPAGVPGLPAGTYTLLPANYALLQGGYRVEIGARGVMGYDSAVGIGNGSFITSATRSVAGTSIRDALWTSVIVTPGSAVRGYSRFNEQGYDAYQLAQAETFGARRSLQAVDGKFLTINLAGLAQGSAARIESALRFDGKALFTPGQGGYGGTLAIGGANSGALSNYKVDMVITASGSTVARTESLNTVAGSEIARFDAPNLYLGGAPAAAYVQGEPQFLIGLNDGLVRSLVLEGGVALTGSQVILSAYDGITLKSGASVNTIGRGILAPDTAATGLLFNSATMLVVSNGSVSLRANNTSTTITLEDGSALYSEGSISFSAGRGVLIGDQARFSTRDLELALPSINIGTAEQLAAAAGNDILPDGLSLNQTVLDRLMRRDPETGTPGLKNLILSATNSINFYGSVNLSTLDTNGKSILDSFVLTTPAIYGHGGWSDSVTLTTDRLVWSGRSLYAGATGEGFPIYKPAAPGAIIADGPGTGVGIFNVDAREVLFGYPEKSRPLNTLQFNRLMLGFQQVNFNASERITSNNVNALAVWRSGASPASTFDPATYTGEAAELRLTTPLLTGDNGSTLSLFAGGALRVLAPNGAALTDTSAVNALGATINLRSVYGAVLLDTAVALPSGKLTVIANDTVQIDGNTRVDLSGRAIPFKDVTKYSWGGDLYLESGEFGSIIILDRPTFDVSAINNHAGSITMVAPDPFGGGGVVFLDNNGASLPSFDGMFKGSSTEGYKSGSFRISASGLDQFDSAISSYDTSFARINQALNVGGFFESREFAIGQGNLTIGDDVRAHHVVVSMNNGSLTVNGRIDASGEAPGSIRLSAKGGLTVASTAALDVHGTKLQTDDDGAVIDAKNRGTIELTAATGWLRLNEGATLDLRSPDEVAHGRVILNAQRTDERTSGNIKIDASGRLDIKGADNIAVYGFWTYAPTDADGTLVQDNGLNPGLFRTVNDAGVLGLNQIGAINKEFMYAALDNAALQGRLAGLAAYGDAYHLRAGVEIDGSGSKSNLTIKGDLDLAGTAMRTADRTYTETEPGSLVIRAGNITINGSISDGFQAVVGTPAIFATTIASGSDLSQYSRALGGPNNFDGLIYYYTAGTVKIDAAWRLPNNAIYREVGGVMDRDGNYYRIGDVIPAGTVFSAYTYLSGIESIPLAIDETPGVRGAEATSASAVMLAAGSQSYAIRIVSGADLQSADTRAVRTLSQLGNNGDMVLARTSSSITVPGVIRTGTGDLDLIAGRDLREDTPYGIYTAGTQIDVGSAYAGVTSQGGYFTQGGGDVRVSAGRNLTGYIWQQNISSSGLNNYSVGNWLVRQGDATTPAAWGIRFGAYGGAKKDTFYGFAGIGTLGGGNLAVGAGNDAGTSVPIKTSDYTTYTSTGIVLAVGSSGRVTSVTRTADGVVTGGTLVQTGGGDMTVEIGGRLNPLVASDLSAADDFNGSFTNVRGDISVQAGSIGAALLSYGTRAFNDPRPTELYRAAALLISGGVGGPVVVIGDGSADLRARGDLVFGGAGNPGMIFPGGSVWDGPSFSLWRHDTAIKLLSAGGNMVPLNTSAYAGQNKQWDYSDGRVMLPPIFEAVAAHGSLYWAGNARIELAPSRDGYLDLLAGDSIYAAAFRVGYSNDTFPAAWSVSGAKTDENSIPNPFRPGTGRAYFQFQPDTVTSNLHEGDDKLIRVEARKGDIVNLTIGDPTPIYQDGWQPRYVAAMPVRVHAGRDIVNFGKNAYRSNSSGDAETQDLASLILNNDVTDVSAIHAGRDILYANVKIAGPGSLDVTAGRNLYLGDKGSIVSIGPLATGDTRPGASILMQAGAGAAGPNYAGLFAYLDPANLAVSGTPLVDQPGKVAKTYESELAAWLKQRFDYETVDAADALAYFTALASDQQAVFLRQVYFAELKAGGREYNDASSSRYGNYVRGRLAIAALFPDNDKDGKPIRYVGDISMFSTEYYWKDEYGSGKLVRTIKDGSVRTLFGGDIQMLTPGGRQVIGVEGVVPGAAAGLVTQGAGNIQLYSKGDILLGLSRIMTTYGGGIL
ncbi:MAG: filamentous hemagglutinin N-terminal domain-containing protein, partial [Rhodospirillaceae bacterium]|nr:filamentous hemagglutinin N-terminal domain-containing protein [Rhodospirillaceae bacterium]